jgi:DNA ligase-1
LIDQLIDALILLSRHDYERLKQIDKKEFLSKIKNEPQTIYLLQGRVFPDYDARELGISEQLVIKALVKASGIKEDKIIQELHEPAMHAVDNALTVEGVRIANIARYLREREER